LLGANPPDYLHQPISHELFGKARTVPQTAYIRPQINSSNIGYFDWLGAASFTADRRTSAMHGKQFLLERAYAGINEQYLFLRLDFADDLRGDHLVEIRVEVLPATIERSRTAFMSSFRLSGRKLLSVAVTQAGNADTDGAGSSNHDVTASFDKVLRARLELSLLGTEVGDTLLLRSTLFREQLPIDSLPAHGWMELPVLAEEDMQETGDHVW
jgi:hypothetical protein